MDGVQDTRCPAIIVPLKLKLGPQGMTLHAWSGQQGPLGFTLRAMRRNAFDDAYAACLQASKAGNVGALADGTPPTTSATVSLLTLCTYTRAVFKNSNTGRRLLPGIGIQHSKDLPMSASCLTGTAAAYQAPNRLHSA